MYMYNILMCTCAAYTNMLPSTGARALPFAAYGEGVGPIHLDDVSCTGTETDLLDCSFNPTGQCGHFEDASVMCQGCATGEVRLIGGTEEYEGRVEVCNSNVWGTVCDNMWGEEDSSVVCRQLGYSQFDSIPRVGAFYGEGRGDIFLNNVACVGTEETLIDCTSDTLQTCLHSEDAGVTCSPNGE